MNSPFDFVLKMTSVERYAIRFLESSGAYITLEQIKAAKVGKTVIVALFCVAEFPMPGKVLNLCLGHNLSNIKNALHTSFRKVATFLESPRRRHILSCIIANSHFAR